MSSESSAVPASASATVLKPRKRSIWRDKYLYLMLLPGLVYFVVYRYLPMYGVTIAFRDFRVTRGILGSEWIGWQNFESVFNAPFFWMVFRNTIIISLYKVVLAFPVPIVLAIMMNEVRKQWYKRSVQTIMYLPHFLSWVVAAHLIVVFMGPHSGVLSGVYADLFGRRLDVLVNPRLFRGLLVVTEIWKTAGWGTIVYLAALAGVDPTLYEAAIIDGARKYQQIIYVTIPTIMPVIVIMFILRVGHILDAGFEQVFVLQNPLVYEVSEILDTYVYKTAFREGRYAFGAAVGLFKAVIGLVLVASTNYVSRRVGQEGMW
jgi:putative aldouronate transport system permease protein